MVAERVGFEPTVRETRTLDFEHCTQSARCPVTRMDARLMGLHTVPGIGCFGRSIAKTCPVFSGAIIPLSEAIR